MQRVLAITPGDHRRGRDLVFWAEALHRAGLRQLLIREPQLDERELATLVNGLAPRLPRLILHLRCAGALELAARAGWGLHLSSGDDVGAVRARHRGPLGVSTHEAAEVVAAASAGADYAVISPVFSPHSKPDDDRPVLGVAAVAAIQRQVAIPVFALGGLTSERASQCRAAGIRGVAGLGAVFTGEPGERARALLAAMEG